jgi:hypothetical protein
MKINDWLAAHPPHPLRPRITCADGFSISVQACAFNYCRPREDGAVHYEAVELGFPNRELPLDFDEYREDPNTLDTVWAYVPVDMVDMLLAHHGGILQNVTALRAKKEATR